MKKNKYSACHEIKAQPSTELTNEENQNLSKDSTMFEK